MVHFHSVRELRDIALDRNVASSLGTAARIARTFNFGRMLPSAYEVPTVYV